MKIPYTGSTDKPRLLIYGKPGTGKTTLAHTILSDTRYLVIDTRYLKDIQLHATISNHIDKFDILSMMSTDNKQKGLLLDNLETFCKYDKRGYTTLLQVCSSKKPSCKQVLVCSDTFHTHRSLHTILYEPIHIQYTYETFYECMHTLCPTVSPTTLHKRIKTSGFNLRVCLSYKDTNDKDTNTKDTNKSKNKSNDTSDKYLSNDYVSEITDINELTYDILRHPFNYTMSDILNLRCDINVLSLNLYENVRGHLRDSHMDFHIYTLWSWFMMGDIYETYMVSSHEYSLREIVTIVKVYKLVSHLKIYQTPCQQPIHYNKYLSRMMTAISNQKQLSSIPNRDEIMRFIYRVYIQKQNIKPPIVSIDSKQARILSQLCEICYHCRITPTRFHKLFP